MKSLFQRMEGGIAATWPASLALAVVACLVLAICRILLTVSFREPLLILTSGLEEEALFSVWKSVQGQTVYSDPFSIPFSGSYFNWFFYLVYGSTTAFVLRHLELADEWIPTITHTLSLMSAVLCIPLSVLVVRELDVLPAKRSFWLGAGAGVLVAFSPLVGWWNLTTRPDIGALLLELSALFLCLRFVKTDRLGYVCAAVPLAFLAWSFRQIAVNTITGLCLYLIVRRRWKILAAAVGVTFTLYGTTFLLGGAHYWSNTVTCLAVSDLVISHGVDNLLLAVRKSPLLLAGIAASAVLFTQTGWRRARPESVFLFLTWAFSLGWNFLTSMKIGASDNYFMPSAALGVFFAVSTLRTGQEGSPTRLLERASLAVLAFAQAATCVVVLGGGAGRIDLREDQVPSLALKSVLRSADGPILVTDRWLNLPWINPTTPHFVYAYVYRAGPLQTHSYEAGGLEGLIDQRYFKRVIVPKGPRGSSWPDLARNYKVQSEDPLFTYYTPAK